MINNQTHIISEGYSMGLAIPAMILLLFSVFLYLLTIWVGLFISLLALSMLLVKTGVEVDKKNLQVRSYKEFLGSRWGSWYALNDARIAVIEYARSAAIMSSRGSSNLVRSETFDLYIKYKSGARILIHEFTKYKYARQVTKVFREEINLAIDDQFLAIQRNIANRKRRGGRRRR